MVNVRLRPETDLLLYRFLEPFSSGIVEVEEAGSYLRIVRLFLLQSDTGLFVVGIGGEKTLFPLIGVVIRDEGDTSSNDVLIIADHLYEDRIETVREIYSLSDLGCHTGHDLLNFRFHTRNSFALQQVTFSLSQQLDLSTLFSHVKGDGCHHDEHNSSRYDKHHNIPFHII